MGRIYCLCSTAGCESIVWRVFVCVKKQMCVKSLTFNYQNKIKTPTDYYFHFDSSDWTIQTEMSSFTKICAADLGTVFVYYNWETISVYEYFE